MESTRKFHVHQLPEASLVLSLKFSESVVLHISPKTPAASGGTAGVLGDICGTTREEVLYVQRVISAREDDTRYITLPRTATEIETATKG